MKAIILANVRTASTFLTNALNSHPSMLWHTGEPLPRKLKGDPGCYSVLDDFYKKQESHKVIGCKVTYYHLLSDWGLLNYLSQCGVSVIHLTRANPLRWILSVKVSAKVKDRPGHITGKSLPVAHIKVDPVDFVNKARICTRRQSLAKQKILETDLRCMHVTYEELTGNREAVGWVLVAEKLCDFLRVGTTVLTSDKRGVNRYPMRKIITNWEEVEPVLLDSEFDYLVREEESWR